MRGRRRRKTKTHSSSGADARHGGDDRDAALLEDGVGNVIRIDGAGGVEGGGAGEGAVTACSCIRSCVRRFISFVDRYIYGYPPCGTEDGKMRGHLGEGPRERDQLGGAFGLSKDKPTQE
jgi:hypothetical protein